MPNIKVVDMAGKEVGALEAGSVVTVDTFAEGEKVDPI